MKLIIKEALTQIPSLSDAQKEIIKFAGRTTPFTQDEITAAYESVRSNFSNLGLRFDNAMAFGAYVAGVISGNRLNAAAAKKPQK